MKNSTKTLPYLLLAAVTILMVYLCTYCPWLGDEIRYMFSFATGDRLHDFKDVIISQNEHYFNINGRYVAHVLVQLFCGLSNHVVFAVCNGLVFIPFALLTLRLAGIKKHETALSVIGISLCFLGFQTRMVPSCQIGYMWMFTLVAIVLWFFLHKQQVERRWWWLLLPFCVVAGWGQEAINLGVCGAMIVYAWQHRKSMSTTQWAIMLAFGFGTLLLVVSPGSLHRVGTIHGSEKSASAVHNMALFLLYILVTYILLAVVITGVVSRRITLRQCYRGYAFYWHVFIICLAMNVFITLFTNRQLFGMEYVALILTLGLLHDMNYRRLNMALTSVALVLLVWVGYHNVKTVNASSADYAEMMAAYHSSKDGVVFMDARQISQPFPCKDICEEYNSEWGISNINKLLGSDPANHGKTLAVLPTAFYPLTTANAFTVNSNNNLFVKCSDSNTSAFTIIRHKDMLGKQRPAKSLHVSVSEEPALYRIGDVLVYVFHSASWYKTDSITFEPLITNP